MKVVDVRRRVTHACQFLLWGEDATIRQQSLPLSPPLWPQPVKCLLPSPPSGSSDEVSLEQESEEDIHSSRSSLDRQSHHRANTTMHVCWYRNTSVSMTDHSVAVEVPSSRAHITITFTYHSVCLGCWFLCTVYMCAVLTPPFPSITSVVLCERANEWVTTRRLKMFFVCVTACFHHVLNKGVLWRRKKIKRGAFLDISTAAIHTKKPMK